MNTENTEHLEAIQDIRNMMKKSTRFLSLSGLSGVFAGIYALIGAYLAQILLDKFLLSYLEDFQLGNFFGNQEKIFGLYFDFIALAVVILALSIVTAYVLSYRKARRQGQTLFDHTAVRVLINLLIPLIAGGVFCVALIYQGVIAYVAPVMLLFYGLALINASKYTYDDIRYLGLCEVVLGLINAFDLGNGLIYWSLGFGVLHIIYGAAMWYKYDRKA